MLLVVLLLLLCGRFGAGLLFDDYTYVVVGGGTAGIALATRLAEAGLKVALVEAGGYYETQSVAYIPAAAILPVGADPSAKCPIDWGFVTDGQPGTNNRAIHFARGKCLGGSSALNFMIYQRPTVESMHQWATAVGDSSYEFEALLPYFKRSIRFTEPDEEMRPTNATAGFDPRAFNPKGEPVHVSYSNYALPFSSWIKLGMEAIGIPETRDFNSGKLMGCQYAATTVRPKDRTRSSSEAAYLGFFHGHPQLTVFRRLLAKRIIFDKSKRAIGVEVKDILGLTHILKANEEVILSAGAFQSPQLLMLSGIGPAGTLRGNGIDILVDLPGVGQNMWDHPFVAPSYRVKVLTFARILHDISLLGSAFINLTFHHNGPFATPGIDLLAWEKIPERLRRDFSQGTLDALAKFPNDWPEVEYIAASAFIGNLSNPVFDQPKDGYDHASIIGVIVAPTSRGNVTIKSSNPKDLPIVNPNWLSEDADQQLAVAMFKRMREAFESNAMADVIIGDEYYPGKQIQTDHQILNYIRDNVMTVWHPACTCKMGTSSDPMAVIDNKARVFGVTGLRVVDASSFPILPPGHPQSTVYALAEKIAEDIVESHSARRR